MKLKKSTKKIFLSIKKFFLLCLNRQKQEKVQKDKKANQIHWVKKHKRNNLIPTMYIRKDSLKAETSSTCMKKHQNPALIQNCHIINQQS